MSYRRDEQNVPARIADLERRMRTMERISGACCEVLFRVTDEGLLEYQMEGDTTWTLIVDLSTYEDSGATPATTLRIVSSNYAITTTDQVVQVTAPATVILPAATVTAGRQFWIKSVTAGAVTVATQGGELIDGATPVVLALYDSLLVVSDGTGWSIL